MSYRARVEEAKVMIMNAGSRRYEEMNENYFKVVEETIAKDLKKNRFVEGWLDYEDPSDFLMQAILDKEEKETVEEIFKNYMRMIDLRKKYKLRPMLDEEETIAEVKRYLAN